MKLGAQFFSIRNMTQTPEGVRRSFQKMHEIGYTVSQMSGICAMQPEMLRDLAEEFNLPITCTHSPFDRIVKDTDNLIKEHKIFNCPVIGLGYMPNEYHSDIEAVRAFLSTLKEPIKKIRDAGLTFAYHNHAFEFERVGGVQIYDILIEECSDMNFILDTYWVKYGNNDIIKYIDLLGGKRMTNIHFKDMKTENRGPICPCGEGVIDFKPIIDKCREVGVKYALVEQDNAVEADSSYDQMEISYQNLKNLF